MSVLGPKPTKAGSAQVEYLSPAEIKARYGRKPTFKNIRELTDQDVESLKVKSGSKD